MKPIFPEPDILFEPGETPEIPLPKAWYPDHVWSVDLTVVSSMDGLWVPWSPNALTQMHPYSWYVLVVIDHFTRRVMGFGVFEQQPTAGDVASTLEQICKENDAKPKHLVSDQGVQFTANEFREWCRTKDIKQRFGAVGKHGSIAVTERVILTYKDGCSRRILVPISRNEMILHLLSKINGRSRYAHTAKFE